MTISEAAKYLRRSPKTLQRWDREGILVAARTPTNRRVYSKQQLDAFLGNAETPNSRSIVAYCRVSSASQKKDLANQCKALETFCAARGFADVEFIEEIGGGLNFKRPKFNKLFHRIELGEICNLVIAHKDRLCRFAFEWFESFCKSHDCELLVLNHESLSPEEELVQDLLAVTHTFSARIYGIQKYKKALAKAVEQCN